MGSTCNYKYLKRIFEQVLLLALCKSKAFTQLPVSMKIAFGQLEYMSITDDGLEVESKEFALETTEYQ